MDFSAALSRYDAGRMALAECAWIDGAAGIRDDAEDSVLQEGEVGDGVLRRTDCRALP